MFNKKGKEPNRTLPPTTPIARSIGKSMSQHSAPSILSSDLAINGSVSSDGEIQLDGMVEGDIRAGSITIGEKSVIKGEVVADNITVRGKVLGKLRGRQIQLASTAHVEGDITHASLSMENGAFFEGQCRHASDPAGAKTAKVNISTGHSGSSTVTPPKLGTKK
jgi:cytoskeletal protein CcmA (bactofilin family)